MAPPSAASGIVRLTQSFKNLKLNAFESPVAATLYNYPSLQPTGYALYHPHYLNAPLRRDLLHRAVIFEADGSRQGTASTKWRGDVHGSNRKILQQKGSGKARAGDKKSPIRRGGGVAFGPHPRDFSTELPTKVYAQAFRIALSHRYRKGELTILDNDINMYGDHGGRWLNQFFLRNQLGSALMVTTKTPGDFPNFFKRMSEMDHHGTIKDVQDVDVKDLLEKKRIIIEKRALPWLLERSSKTVDLRAVKEDPEAEWAIKKGLLQYPGLSL